MKRLVSVAIVLCMAVAIISTAVPVSAAQSSITTDKEVYEVGEPIMVSATSANGDEHDWVGILPKGAERWGSLAWIYLKDFNGEVDITKPNISSNSFLAPYKSFPAGEYTIYLIPDDLSIFGNEDKALAKVDIRIGSEEDFKPIEVKAPTGAVYTPVDPEGELIDGEATVNFKKGHNGEEVWLFWGDANGRLADYGRISSHNIGSSWKTELTFEMRSGIKVPAGATRLLFYTYNHIHGLSKDYFAAELPEGLAYEQPEGKPLMEFQVVSDAHISSELHAEHFKKMLEDIAKNSPDSAGIFAVGDMVDNGKINTQWKDLWRLYESVEGAPDMYLGMGNHEIYDFDSYNAALDKFLDNIRLPEGYEKPETPYYDLWIGGLHFIFLGDTDLPSEDVKATIGNEQYAWLAEKLAENADGRPIFLFMHQPLRDTVSGSLADQGWWGIEDDEYLRVLLEEYPQIIMFNGHTHWTLDDENAMFGGNGAATIFNTAGVGYLWTSQYKVAGQYLEGSQGYYVKVYEDRIVVQGRDFVNGEWLPAAYFELTGVNIPEDVGGTEIKLPESDQSDEPVITPTDKPTEKTEETPTDDVASEKDGCGASITLGGASAVLIVACVSLALGRKKEY